MPDLSRRQSLRLGGGAAALAGVPLLADTLAPARAAAETAAVTKTRVLPPAGRHLVSRFSYGVTPALATQVHQAGGARAWFAKQLTTAYTGASTAAIADWWPELHLDAQTLWQHQVSGGQMGWEVMSAYAARQLVRRMTSPHQVLETMTEFWENHLHVPALGDAQFNWRTAYGDVIRRNALGRFDTMLAQAITHPAMLLFLDGADSTRDHPNENLGRELLELHTVGVGAYTETDVKNSARILTGYHVDAYETWAASYVPDDHWVGAVRVMGFSDPNTAADGRKVAQAYLRYLAHHPRTATHVATRLATFFVSDTPPASLVARLAKVYTAHDTAIVPVLQALVASTEFAHAATDPTAAKVRDPGQDIVATHRVLGTRITRPTTHDAATNAIVWQAGEIGLQPFGWARPDGTPLTGSAWASPARALASIAVHWSMAGSWWPTDDITYRTPKQWLPHLPVSFRDAVDEMSRQVLGVVTPSGTLHAACLATDIGADEPITADHELMTWKWPRLMGVLLDHPIHYTR